MDALSAVAAACWPPAGCCWCWTTSSSCVTWRSTGLADLVETVPEPAGPRHQPGSAANPCRARGGDRSRSGFRTPGRRSTSTGSARLQPSLCSWTGPRPWVPPELTPENAETVASIVWRLDGLPLAIEARRGTVPGASTPRPCSARLDDTMTSPAIRDLPERQQTVAATVEWSVEVLSGRGAGAWSAALASCPGGSEPRTRPRPGAPTSPGSCRS